MHNNHKQNFIWIEFRACLTRCEDLIGYCSFRKTIKKSVPMTYMLHNQIASYTVDISIMSEDRSVSDNCK